MKVLLATVNHIICLFMIRLKSSYLDRPLQEYYILAPGHIYQAPDAASAISHRLVNAFHFNVARLFILI